MNYAEDRLDRRACTAANASFTNNNNGDVKNVSAGRGGGNYFAPLNDATMPKGIVVDLNRAHASIRRLSLNALKDSRDGMSTQPELDRSNIEELPNESLEEFRRAHELLGKTLRDCGFNRQAVFHFGMAWLCHSISCSRFDRSSSNNADLHHDLCPNNNDWRSAGDYAQMAELAGYPEVGALALLFYRAGGRLQTKPKVYPEFLPTKVEQDKFDPGCGCGMAECGSSSCFIAFRMSSPVLEEVLQALDAMDLNCRRSKAEKITLAEERDGNEPPLQTSSSSNPTASKILAQLQLMRRRHGDNVHHVKNMNTFLKTWGTMPHSSPKDKTPSILQFWCNKTSCSPSIQCGSNSYRHLPPVLQLLLLKLLYTSPCAGPFLQLACLSVPYLYFVTSLERTLAKDFKSHVAYFVLIRSLVLGERVNKRKLTKNPGNRGAYHVPVWDLIHGLDKRFSSDQDGAGCDTYKSKDLSFSGLLKHCCKMLDTCACCTAPSQHQFNEINESSSGGCSSQKRPRSSVMPPVNPRTFFHSDYPPLFILGDSHILSLAWQALRIFSPSDSDYPEIHAIKPRFRTMVPFPSTGMKAWHTRSSTPFFTHFNLHACLQRLPISQTQQRRTIILSAGEIDCREGIGGALLQGYYNNCSDAVEHTVKEYLRAVSILAKNYCLQILLMPVAPHAYRSEKNGKALGRAKRRERTHLWNEVLRKECKLLHQQSERQKSAKINLKNYVFLLDYEKGLRSEDSSSPVGYVLNPIYNADYTHVNSGMLPLLEKSLTSCGCDLSLL